MKQQKTTTHNVPKLRFPGFRNAGAWDKYRLGQCLTKHPEYGINAPAVPYSDKLPTYLRITDISEDGYFIRNQKVSVANKVKEANYLDEGDIVLARTGASVGKSYKYRKEDGRLVFAGFLIRVKPDKEKLNSELLFHFLATEQFWHWVDYTSARSGQPGINGNEYSLLPIPLPPSIKEQKKIADCLSSIDELITAQAQKLDALKAHKKGLMQQLFPAEGETVPKLRFPEFRDVGAWEKHKVSSLLRKVSNPVNVEQNKMYRQIGIRSHGKGIFHKELVSGKELGSKRVFWVEVDAFVVNIVFAWERAIANTSSAEKGMIASHRFPMYKAIPNKSDVHYILYFFLTNEGKSLLWIASPGGAGRNKTLGQKEFENLEFFLPEKVEEQTKIADCLSSIDDLITAQTQNFETLKAHKKGLMQQLFPSMDEVNG